MASKTRKFVHSLLAELLPGWVKAKRGRSFFRRGDGVQPRPAASPSRGTIQGDGRSAYDKRRPKGGGRA